MQNQLIPIKLKDFPYALYVFDRKHPIFQVFFQSIQYRHPSFFS